MPAPENLQVSWEPVVLPTLKVTWRETYTVSDGYDVECKAGDAAFTNIFGNTMGRQGLPQFYIRFGDYGETMPEAMDLQYRIRYVKNGKHSEYSNLATVRAQIRAPRVVTYLEEKGPALAFTWTNQSQVADTLTLERASGPAATTLGAWAPIPGPAFGATSFQDEDRPEDPWVAYRVVYSKGSDKGSTVFGAVQNPLKAPVDFQAVAGMSYVDLSWRNVSSMATELVVRRQATFGDTSSWEDIAHLPVTATSYRDASPINPYNGYRVEARQTGRLSGKSIILGTALLPEPQGGTSFTTSVPTLPVADNGQRDAQGRWSFAGNTTQDGHCLWIPSGNGWAKNPVQSIASMPQVRLDSGGHPHSVMKQRPDSAATEDSLVHVWHDGTAWRREEIARVPRLNTGTDRSFAHILDGQDRLLVVWMDGLDIDLFPLHCARRNPDGQWVRLPDANLPSSSFYDLSQLLLTVAGDGAPIVLRDQDLLAYSAANGWSTSVAAPGLPTFDQDANSLRAEADGSITLIYFSNQVLWTLSYASGAWAPPQAVLSTAGLPTQSYNAARVVSAFSPSGNRLVVGLACQQGTYLCIREGGAWKTIRLGAGSGYCPMLAFGADDRILALHQAERVPLGDTSQFVLFTEVR